MGFCTIGIVLIIVIVSLIKEIFEDRQLLIDNKEKADFGNKDLERKNKITKHLQL